MKSQSGAGKKDTSAACPLYFRSVEFGAERTGLEVSLPWMTFASYDNSKFSVFLS
jgi:hypothetical protein